MRDVRETVIYWFRMVRARRECQLQIRLNVYGREVINAVSWNTYIHNGRQQEYRISMSLTFNLFSSAAALELRHVPCNRRKICLLLRRLCLVREYISFQRKV